MKLTEYLRECAAQKRILVVSDLGKGQALIRDFGNVSGEIITNVECKTIRELAKEICCYLYSERNMDEAVQVLETDEACMLFRSVLIDHISDMKYFNDERMMSIGTVEEIFDKVNLIRENRWSSIGDSVQNDKINDLKMLIALYEQKLEDKSMMDETGLLRFVSDAIKGIPEEERSLIINGEITAVSEDLETATHLRRDFLETVKGNNQETPLFVEVFDEQQDENPEYANLKDKAIFFKGYGSINEAAFIADDIISKGVPYGDVSVIYTSSTQVSAISAALKGNGITASFTSTHTALDNPYITLIKEILDWAEDNYSEICLDRILASTVIQKDVLWSYEYFDHVLNARNRRDHAFALGWGFARNREFLEHEERLDTESKKKDVRFLHRALLDIFADAGALDSEITAIRPCELFERIRSFIMEYTETSKAYAPVKNYMNEIDSTLRMEERELPLSESLKLIRTLLEQISDADSESEDAVKVEQFNDWTILGRPYVYVIGLALKELQSSAVESPVLSDEEILTLLDCAFSPTVINKAKRKARNLWRTMQTFNGEQIAFGFASYDTVNFQDNNPSSFYREMVHIAGADIAKATEFVYGNPESKVCLAKEDAEYETDVLEIREKTSCSSMEKLLDCPKQYYFDRVLRDSEFLECDHMNWLDPKEFGSFFHEVAEQYTIDQLIPTEGRPCLLPLDEKKIADICENVRKEFASRVPAAYPELTEKETAEIVQMAVNYFGRLTDEMNENGWKSIIAEGRFEGYKLLVQDYNGVEHEFLFNGIVDRVDYKLDQEKKEVLLRIADYKTGRKNPKKKALALGKLLQPLIYRRAVIDKGALRHHIIEEIAKAEQMDEIKDYDVAFEKFYYVFPKELEDTEPLACDIEDEVLLMKRMKSIMTVYETEHFYPNKPELLKMLNEKEKEYKKADSSVDVLIDAMCDKDDRDSLNKNEADSCRYCGYQDLCIERKAGVINANG